MLESQYCINGNKRTNHMLVLWRRVRQADAALPPLQLVDLGARAVRQDRICNKTEQ